MFKMTDDNRSLRPHFTHFARKFMKFQRSSEANHGHIPVPFNSRSPSAHPSPKQMGWTGPNKNVIYLLIYAHRIKYLDFYKGIARMAQGTLRFWPRCVCGSTDLRDIGEWEAELLFGNQELKSLATGHWKVGVLSCLFVGLCNPLRMTACIVHGLICVRILSLLVRRQAANDAWPRMLRHWGN